SLSGCHRMTEFRRAEKRRRIRRKWIRFLTAACFATVVVTGVYSFVSEGASGQDYIQTPPLTGILESAEAPGERNETERGPGVSVKEEPEESAAGGNTGPAAGREENGEEKNDAEAAEPEESEYLGEFEVTGYCGCDICCGTKEVKLTKMETVPKPDYTVAADPEVIPLGSSIVIEGTVYHVEDVGQAIKGKSVDIFFASHEEAKNFGRQKLSVYLK
ncbi:3D domain-containing protein, partial [Hungatella sp.]